MVGIVPPAVSTGSGGLVVPQEAPRPTRDTRPPPARPRSPLPSTHDIDTLLARLRRHARGQGRGDRLPIRGRGLARVGRRPAVPRCDRGALVLQRRVRAARDRRCGRGAAHAARRRIRRSVPTRPNRHSIWPIDWPGSPRSTTPSCSSARAARTRSTRRRSSPGATGTSWVDPRSASSCRASTATTACTPGARRSPGIPGNKAGYGGEIIEEVVNVGANDTESLGALFESRGAEIAAFIGEPVIGAGGVYPPEPSYWAEVQRLCREHDVLLIADEVITGFGRTGVLWGSQRYSIEPDMILFAKGVTSGYLPLGGVIVGRRVQEPFWDGPAPGPAFMHGYTYSGHAAACAAAEANLDILEREGLVATGRDPGARPGRRGPPAGMRCRSSGRSGPSG